MNNRGKILKILIALGLFGKAGILLFVVPRCLMRYRDLRTDLPFATVFLIEQSHLWWLIAIAAVLLTYALFKSKIFDRLGTQIAVLSALVIWIGFDFVALYLPFCKCAARATGN